MQVSTCYFSNIHQNQNGFYKYIYLLDTKLSGRVFFACESPTYYSKIVCGVIVGQEAYRIHLWLASMTTKAFQYRYGIKMFRVINTLKEITFNFTFRFNYTSMVSQPNGTNSISPYWHLLIDCQNPTVFIIPVISCQRSRDIDWWRYLGVSKLFH